jgi:hypothetical protein
MADSTPMQIPRPALVGEARRRAGSARGAVTDVRIGVRSEFDTRREGFCDKTRADR